MMRRLISASLRFRFLVIALASAMMIVGIALIPAMPVDAFPEFAPPRVEIQVEAPGMSTVEVEELITVPLEEALNGTQGLVVMRSKSVPGLASINLLFEPGSDIWRARQLVSERLATAIPNLPSVITVPIILPPLSSTSRAMFVGLSSDEMSLLDLSTIAFWDVRAALLAVPGVANVAIWGERLQQIHVQVDPARMRAHGVSVDQVAEITADALEVGLFTYTAAAHPGIGGWIETPQQRLAIRHVLPISTPEELAQVVVKIEDGVPLRLGDLGRVVEDHPPLIGDAVINDGPGLLLVVEKFPWGNTLELTRGVEAALADLQQGLPGVEMDTTIFRPATFIELAIGNLSWALLIGALLVMVILLFFLWEWRVALISMVAIPLSLMAGALVLHQLGATINVMVLAGFVIAIGVVVDDAIIDVENITRRLRQNRLEGSTESTASIVLHSSLEVRSAIIYATLIDVVAIAPVFFLEGLTGAFFGPLAIAYGLSVLASMAVALTVTPALALILLRNAPIERRDSPLARWLKSGYERGLSRIIHTARPAFAAVAIIAVLGVIVTPQLGQSLLPDFKERDFLMHWLTKPGTSHPEMTRITTAASQELRSIPGVRNFGAHIGRAIASDEVVGIYFTENWVSVDPSADYDATRAAIQQTVDGYPGIVRDVQTYLKERTKEVLTGTSEAIVVRIYGPELAVLRGLAEEVRQKISEIEGVDDLHTELQVDIPQVEVEVDLAKADRYGIKPGDVRRAAGALVAGIEVGDIYRDGKAFDVALWSTPETRTSLTSLRELLIDTPSGGQVRLADVAKVEIVPTPNEVKHEGVFRRIDVGLNVAGRDLGSVARDVEEALRQVDFPLEYHPELLGEYAERQAAQGRLLLLGIAALIGVFLLLHTSFGSARLATLSFLTLPSALVGGVLAAYLTGGILSLGSLIGFFTVLGIAARNGIMMINHFQHLEHSEGEPFGFGLVLRGARERLSPILMTALATGLALVPLAIAGDLPGHEIEHPMAIVILGGLVTSTLLNLFIVPSLYLRFGRHRPRKVIEAQADS
ncbi:MAG: acriflavin resistance protein [Chloroflexi bacterium CSP1-4]|nr:MAG: acriflavin resistance protein [Chloroflexi bacterium CSP1-4]